MYHEHSDHDDDDYEDDEHSDDDDDDRQAQATAARFIRSRGSCSHSLFGQITLKSS